MIQNYILTLSFFCFFLNNFLDISETYWSTKPRKFMLEKKYNKNLHIIEDGANGDYEQVIVKKLF